MTQVEHRVIFGDTDAGGVVYYANYFRWFESGRRELMRDFNIDYSTLDEDDILTPVVEARCNYYHPARFDDIISVETKITEIKDKTIRFEHKVYRKRDKKLLASGYTINVFVDKSKMKSINIPSEIRKKIRVG